MVDLTIIIPIAGLAAIGTAAYLAREVLRLPPGDEAMQRIGNAIREGARAFWEHRRTG